MTNSNKRLKVGDMVIHQELDREGKVTEIALRPGTGEVCRVDWKQVPYHMNFTWHQSHLLMPLSSSL